MALIECIDCGKQISDKSAECLNCGCPVPKSNELKYEKPLLPTNVGNLGDPKQGVVSFLQFKCHVLVTGSDGNVSAPRATKLTLHERGFSVGGFKINYNQAVKWEVLDSDAIMESNKSPLLRAALGGVLLGGVGAIVGGVSGLNKKQIAYDKLLSIVVYKPDSDTFSTYQVAYNSDKCNRLVSALFDEIEKAKRVIKQPIKQPQRKEDFIDQLESVGRDWLKKVEDWFKQNFRL